MLFSQDQDLGEEDEGACLQQVLKKITSASSAGLLFEASFSILPVLPSGSLCPAVCPRKELFLWKVLPVQLPRWTRSHLSHVYPPQLFHLTPDIDNLHIVPLLDEVITFFILVFGHTIISYSYIVFMQRCHLLLALILEKVSFSYPSVKAFPSSLFAQVVWRAESLERCEEGSSSVIIHSDVTDL